LIPIDSLRAMKFPLDYNYPRSRILLYPTNLAETSTFFQTVRSWSRMEFEATVAARYAPYRWSGAVIRYAQRRAPAMM